MCTTDPSGYGMTIEQCDAACGHWRVVECGYAQPAHTHRPRGNGRTARQGLIGRPPILPRLLAVLPASAEDAIDSCAVAERAGQRYWKTARIRLAEAAAAGLCQRRPVHRGGLGRPAWHYYRAVA